MVGNVDDLVIKMPLLRLNGSFAKTMGISYIPGATFIKLEGDYLFVPVNEFSDEEKNNIDLNAKYISLFRDKAKDMNTEFLYVNFPSKFSRDKDILPVGFADYKNEQSDRLLEALEKENINYIDIRDNFSQDFKDNYMSRFYKTDHHWKTNNGPYTAEIISNYLNENYGYDINCDVFDEENYTEKKYKDIFLGSTGENSTLSFTEAEDFSVYLPEEKAEYKFSIPTKEIEKSGNFDIMINYDKFNEKAPCSAYSSYIYANSAYVNIVNNSIKDTRKLLIIKDSYANSVIPYMAQVIKEVDVLDIRTSQTDHFNSSVLELMEKNQYDMVMIMYSPYATPNFDRLFLK